MTADSDARIRMQALRSGAVAKPFDDEVLLETVRVALKRGPNGDEA